MEEAELTALWTPEQAAPSKPDFLQASKGNPLIFHKLPKVTGSLYGLPSSCAAE